MKVIHLEGYGGVDQLHPANVPQPEPQHGEVLVRIHATSVNPIDWKIRSGFAKERFPQQFPAILGRDLAGEVVRLGPGVSGFTIGERVMGLGLHTYAEYATAPADTLALIPDALDYEHAAALPLVLLTGAQLVERAAKVQRGQTILVTGALGSVGRAAVFVAQQHGAHVIAGVRKAQLAEAAALKTKQVVALDDEAALKRLKDLDAVADTVGGELSTKLLLLVKVGGVFASAVRLPEDGDNPGVRIARVMAEPDARRLRELAEAEATGEFVIPIARVMPLSEVREAQTLSEKGGAGGKIVLTV